MSIALDPRLPKQMNGPVINAYMQALGENLDNAEQVADYLFELSLATAQEAELESLGKIIGYPRPLIPSGFANETMFVLGDLPMSTDPLRGLANLTTLIGGELTTKDGVDNIYMNLESYRRALRIMARIKAKGITLEAVDQVAALINAHYEISWSEKKDIIVHYTEQIGYAKVWTLSKLFYRVATAPQVLITAG